MSIALVFALENLGTIFEMINSIGSVLDAPIFVLFILGILFPFVGNKGALVGGYSTLIFNMWLVGGRQWHVFNKHIRYEHLPTTVEGCDSSFNRTLTTDKQPLNDEELPFFLFRISMYHFTTTGSLVGITIAIC